MFASAALAGVAACVATADSARAVEADPARTHLLYSVSAHPDDEFANWGMIENRPDRYLVSVLITLGEETDSCVAAEDSPAVGDPGLGNGTVVEGFGGGEALGIVGPYKYQGPGSPVGEPDKGERRPLGNPWQGQGTGACGRARVGSWHWFLDDMSALDSGLSNMAVADDPELDDDYQGRFCRTGAGCVKVWANADGARVAFDLGDRGYPIDLNPDPLTADKVIRAIQVLRSHRKQWGLPALPDGGILAAVPNPGEVETGSDCPTDPHPDHLAVADALYEVAQGAGPQFGAACPSDPRYEAAPGPADAAIDPDTVVQANLIDPVTEERQGPWVVNYGWLYGTYAFAGGVIPTYWERFADAKQPRIRLSVRPRQAPTGTNERYRFRATMPGVEARVPLSRVMIRFAGKRARTNGSGRATIRKQFGTTGGRRARASLSGMRRGMVLVRISRS